MVSTLCPRFLTLISIHKALGLDDRAVSLFHALLRHDGVLEAWPGGVREQRLNSAAAVYSALARILCPRGIKQPCSKALTL